MAARRLLIVMLILLGLSTLAAALIPRQSLREGTSGTTASEPTETTPTATAPAGRIRRETIRADRGKLQVISIAAGDQLSLTVTSKRFDQVELPGLGLVQAVAPAAPAHFELLLQATESYGVRLIEAKRLVARIEVRKRGRAPGAEARSRARAAPGRA